MTPLPKSAVSDGSVGDHQVPRYQHGHPTAAAQIRRRPLADYGCRVTQY